MNESGVELIEKYFCALRKSKNSDLYRQILSWLEFVDREYIIRNKKQVIVEFYISRSYGEREFKYRCKLSKYGSKVFEIYRREGEWEWGDMYSNVGITLNIIGIAFGNLIKNEVSDELEAEAERAQYYVQDFEENSRNRR
jgi:hypothetical protein